MDDVSNMPTDVESTPSANPTSISEANNREPATSIIPDVTLDNSTSSVNVVGTRKARYPIHNPLGPRYYKNHHLTPPHAQREQETIGDNLVDILPRAEDATFVSKAGEDEHVDQQLLFDLQKWVVDPYGHPVYWLDEGAGVSAIARGFSEWLYSEFDLLGGSFFCSRDFQDRSDIQLVFPTLAFQLAQRYADFRAVLLPIINSTPDIRHEPLTEQLSKLLIQPLQSTGLSTVFVINALDECRQENSVSTILSLLAKVEDLPGVKFFITSRQQRRITGCYPQLVQTYNGSLSLYKVALVPSAQDYSEAEIDTMLFISPDAGGGMPSLSRSKPPVEAAKPGTAQKYEKVSGAMDRTWAQTAPLAEKNPQDQGCCCVLQ